MTAPADAKKGGSALPDAAAESGRHTTDKRWPEEDKTDPGPPPGVTDRELLGPNGELVGFDATPRPLAKWQAESDGRSASRYDTKAVPARSVTPADTSAAVIVNQTAPMLRAPQSTVDVGRDEITPVTERALLPLADPGSTDTSPGLRQRGLAAARARNAVAVALVAFALIAAVWLAMGSSPTTSPSTTPSSSSTTSLAPSAASLTASAVASSALPSPSPEPQPPRPVAPLATQPPAGPTAATTATPRPASSSDAPPSRTRPAPPAGLTPATAPSPPPSPPPSASAPPKPAGPKPKNDGAGAL